MRIILPPLKWSKATDGIDAGDFFRRMAECEASMFPAGTLFPRPGQVWETVRDCDVHVHISVAWVGRRYSHVQLPTGETVVLHGQPDSEQRCPYGMTRLRAGERVRVLDEPDVGSPSGPKPLYAVLRPLRYDELQASIVPAELRAAEGYDGYRLVVRTARPAFCAQHEGAYLNDDFRRIEQL